MVIAFVVCIALLPCDSSTKTDSFCFCCGFPEGFLVSSFFTRFSPPEPEALADFSDPEGFFLAPPMTNIDLRYIISYTSRKTSCMCPLALQQVLRCLL